MSFKIKLTLMLATIVVFFQALTAIVNDYKLRVNLRSELEAAMQQCAGRIAETVDVNRDSAQPADAVEQEVPGAIIQHYQTMLYWIREIGVFRTAQQLIAGEAGAERLTDSLTDSLIYGEYTLRSERTDAADAAAAMRSGAVYRSTRIDDHPVMIGTFGFPGADNGIVRLVADVGQMQAMIQSSREHQLIVSGVMLLLAVLFSYGLAGMLVRPLRMILVKVNEVASGRFDTPPLSVKRRDEIGQLAERVNAMTKNLDVYTTKLKKAFEENRSMKEYLESIINHTTDAIHIEDVNGTVIRVNQAFTTMFGWSVEEAVGNKLQIVPDDRLKEEQEAKEALLAGHSLPARETVRCRKDGTCLEVSVTTSVIRDRSGVIQAFASITRDMTNRNKMDELLRRAEKLNTVGQLAAGVAHEIRNPLTTLRGFLQLQQQTHTLNPRHIDIMLSELDRINLIVGEFLILAKPQATKFQIQDVRFVLGDVISLLDSQAHLCNIVFNTSFDSEPCEIACEENQLKQVFINVLKNAIEAMPKGGEIEIEVRRQPPESIVVMIRDHGVGISEDMIPKLGDPFVTSKETGTGLGIMVSQRIIQSHQGTMDIRSAVGEGTTVTITLPALAD